MKSLEKCRNVCRRQPSLTLRLFFFPLNLQISQLCWCFPGPDDGDLHLGSLAVVSILTVDQQSQISGRNFSNFPPLKRREMSGESRAYLGNWGKLRHSELAGNNSVFFWFSETVQYFSSCGENSFNEFLQPKIYNGRPNTRWSVDLASTVAFRRGR